MPHRPLPKDANFPQLEEQILERWRERDIYNESMRRREGAPPFVFYEGPPTANGRPGSHHVLARVFKDIFPRYKTMQGFYSYRKGGWDCHGLPVEIAVQEQLGIESKQQIEEYGIAAFNQKCREQRLRVPRGLDEADRADRLLGRPRRSVPHARHAVHRVRLVGAEAAVGQGPALRGLQGRPVLPARRHVAVLARGLAGLQGRRGPERLRQVPGHPARRRAARGRLAARVDDDALDAGLQRRGRRRPRAHLRALDRGLRAGRGAGRPRARRRRGGRRPLHGRGHGRRGLRAAVPVHPGVGVRREGPHRPARRTSSPPRTAPASSTPRSRSARTTSGSAPSTASTSSTRCARTAPTTSASARTRASSSRHADHDLIEDLEARGRMFRSERLLHSYPHCWRCGTPLLYYAKPTWYIRMSAVKDRLLAANETVDWHPEHIKHGRFGRWLENNVDWALGRERYWGTPLPIWRNEAGEALAVGSFEELRELSGVELEDPHRPFVDDVVIPSPTGGEPLRRVPEVIDVWFDSGSMPFAQWHAPFENQDKFDEQFPADYICEAIDQTRGWFYSPDRDLDAALRPELLQDRALPRPHRRSRGQEDVEVARQHRRAVGRHRPPRRGRLPLVLPDQQAAVGRLPVQRRHRRRVAAPVPAAAVEHVRLLRDVRERQRRRAGRRRARQRPRPLGAVAAGRDGRDRHRAPGRTTTPPAPARRSRPSSTTSPTGTCAARAAASGTATRPRSRRCAPAW